MSGAIVTHDAVSGAVVRALVPIAAGQPIYDERMLQDFTEPCFFVIEPSVTEEKQLDRYWMYEHKIEVSYFPKPQAMTDRRLLSEWRQLLFSTLRKIDVDAYMDSEGKIVRLPLRAHAAECRWIEDHLVYYANYSLRCREVVDEGVIMQKLIENQNIK